MKRFWYWLLGLKPCPYCNSTETREVLWFDYDYSFAVMNNNGDGWLTEPTPDRIAVLICDACGGRS